MNARNRKQKIAILGGGWGAVSTALYLTDPKNPRRNDYDITFYQLGWRLGGKGASGRGIHDRIEEHGLHVWMGFYDNSFKAIQEVYEEVQPIYRRLTNYDKNPFKSWEDAFKPHNYIALAESINAQWKIWGIDFPTNPEIPGQGGHSVHSPWEYLRMLIQFLHHYFRASAFASHQTDEKEHEDILERLSGLTLSLEVMIKSGFLVAGESILETTLDVLERLDSNKSHHHEKISSLLRLFLERLEKDMEASLAGQIQLDDTLRRIATVLYLGATIAIGLIEDGVLTHEEGLDSIDKYDFREWLRRHGAPEWVVLSAPVQALYDLVFGYRDGEIAKPNFAAGVAVRSALRIALTYKGSVFWKMQAGMGDVVFAPPYLVLKERGVKFKYFHKVTGLGIDPDTSTIDTLEIGVQATLKPEISDYDPLIIVKDLPCWPAEPNYDQLVQGEELKQKNINLESFYTPWTDVETLTLSKSAGDFDQVVLGISIAALPYISQALSEQNPRFAKMLTKVETVRTQAAQLWLNKDLVELGWDLPSPVMDAYTEPLNTWADMTQLIDKENWPDDEVKNIAYFCGPMVGGIPPVDHQGAPEKAKTRTWQVALDYTQSQTGFLWSKATPFDNPNGLDFNCLVAPGAKSSMERFEAQYVRANLDPSERYVLSVQGSTQYRLKANESGYSNLVLTGDWIRNGFNAGCIEATTMSGMQASNVISGYPGLDQIDGLEVHFKLESD